MSRRYLVIAWVMLLMMSTYCGKARFNLISVEKLHRRTYQTQVFETNGLHKRDNPPIHCESKGLSQYLLQQPSRLAKNVRQKATSWISGRKCVKSWCFVCIGLFSCMIYALISVKKTDENVVVVVIFGPPVILSRFGSMIASNVVWKHGLCVNVFKNDSNFIRLKWSIEKKVEWSTNLPSELLIIWTGFFLAFRLNY